jgi:hypothetical protein
VLALLGFLLVLIGYQYGTVPHRVATDTVSSDDGEAPTWVTRASQPPRSVIMSIRLREIETDQIDYEIHLLPTDPLVDEIIAGKLDKSDLVWYLAGGPANTPIEIERAAGAKLAIVRLSFIGELHDEDYAGDDDALNNPAARATVRKLSISTDVGVLCCLSPKPLSQTRRSAYYEGRPQSVAWNILADVPDDNGGSTQQDEDQSVSILFRLLQYLTPVSWFVWMAVMLAPWIVVIRSSHWFTHGWIPSFVVLRSFAIWLTVTTVMIGLGIQGGDILLQLASPILDHLPVGEASGRISLDRQIPFIALALGAILLGWVVVRILSKVSTVQIAPRRIVVLSSSFLILTAVLAINSFERYDWLQFVTITVCAVTLSALGFSLLFGRTNLMLGFSVGLIGAGLPLVLMSLQAKFASGEVLAAALLGLTLAMFLIVQLKRAEVLIKFGWLKVAFVLVCGIFMFMPIAALYNGAVWSGVNLLGWQAAVQALPVLNVLLAAGTLIVFRRAGRSATAMRIPWILAIGCIPLLVCVTSVRPYSILDLLSIVTVALGWKWLTASTPRSQATRLGKVSRDGHRTLITAYARRRLALASAADFYRGHRTKLANSEAEWNEYERRQRKLDAVASTEDQIEGVDVHDAQSTSGGATPWQNALRAAAFASPVAALIIGYEIIGLVSIGAPASIQELNFATALGISAHLMRWLAYAFAFGYFYTYLRGRTPVSKAMALAVLILVAEILQIFVPKNEAFSTVFSPSVGNDYAVAAAIRIGQVIVFFAVLGLLWERWLAVAAGYRWDRLRNVRTVRALLAPLSTVAVAVATAAGTALAGVAVATLLSNGAAQSPPKPTPVQVSPTP